MALFRRNRAGALSRSLEEHSYDWAVSAGASRAVAGCYAEYVVVQDAAGEYGEPGVDHGAEWPAWCARNLAACPSCGSPWAILVPCVSCWECWDCGFSWDAQAA